MSKRDDRDQHEYRAKLIGLGKSSISKSYYPELKERLDQLEHFRALVDQINDAIYVIDVETGLISDISGAATSLANCMDRSLVGTRFSDLLPEHIAKHLDNLFNSKAKTTAVETELCCPSCAGAEPVPVEITVRVTRHGNKKQAVVVARDVSRRKKAEEELRKNHEDLELRVMERTRELDLANQAKSEFLSMVSHELRTPLTSVLGFAKIIRKKLLESIFPAVSDPSPKLRREMAQVAENVEIITSEGQRLTGLINDVLDLAKLEANKIEYKMEPLNPESFINQSAQALRGLFDENGLKLAVDLEPELPMVMGDHDRLVQVMVNLLSNALKFTKKGSVTCQARAMARHVRISVQDTGIGIPRSQQEEIFEKFTQARETMEGLPKGTGLGLAICRNIVHGHNGYIWVESVPGKGSEFIFTLPQLKKR